jgi:hypothetical protein
VYACAQARALLYGAELAAAGRKSKQDRRDIDRERWMLAKAAWTRSPFAAQNREKDYHGQH